MREYGIVATFRGTWGFISPRTGADIFVSYRGIDAIGFRTLKAGQKVTFVRGKDMQGRECAQQVRVEQEAA